MNPTTILAAIAAALAMVAGLFAYLYNDEVKDHANFRSSVVAARAQAEQDAIDQRARQENTLAVYGQRWADAVAHRDEHPAIRVLPRDCGVSQAGTLPAATGIHAPVQTGSAGIGPVQTITIDQCEDLANRSLLDAEWIENAKQITDALHEASK